MRLKNIHEKRVSNTKQDKVVEKKRGEEVKVTVTIFAEWEGLNKAVKNGQPLKGKVQFSSVAQSCPTLCDTMNCSTPGLPVHHQLPEFTQTHVH